MNEMNNGENNNQNIEQQNMNHNNVEEPVQEEQNMLQNNVEEPIQGQPVQPEQPVSKPQKKKEDKSYCGLLIVFMIISLLLAGFIVYDKAIKKEEPEPIKTEEGTKTPEEKPIEPKEENKTPEEETKPPVEETPVVSEILKNKKSANGEKYFRVDEVQKELDGKKVNVALAFYVKKGKTPEEDRVYYDIYVNGTRTWTELVQINQAASGCEEDCGNYRKLYDFYDENGKLIDPFADHGEDIDNKIVELEAISVDTLFSIIKDTSKAAHYIVTYDKSVGLAVIDANGKVLVNERTMYGINAMELENINGCTRTYNQVINPTSYTDDAIYYLIWTNEADEEKMVDYVEERKITIDNGIAKETVVKTCTANLLGMSS